MTERTRDLEVGSIVAELRRAQEILGADAVGLPDDSESTDDELVELAETTLDTLRERAGSGSPQALAAALAAYDLADALRTRKWRSVERRMNGLSAVQRALAELRAIGTVDAMLKRSTRLLCERIGFDWAVLIRIEGDTVYPASSFDRRIPDSDAMVWHLRDKLGNLQLDDLPVESEMIRRRTPAIVHDVRANLRALQPSVGRIDIDPYVAAPIVPEGKVIGFLHATVHYQRRHVDVIDRDILWAFAEGYGYALERTILRNQVRQQRQRIRELLRNADELLNEIGEADVQIDRADSESAVRWTASLPAGGSRVHALLTPREIEVMELIVHGSTNKQVAERLVMTEGTVKTHVTHIFRKLRAANRAEAVHRYMQLLTLDYQ